MGKRLISVLLSLTLWVLCSNSAFAEETDLSTLSAKISKVQSSARKITGATQIYIGGGSARNLLDNLYSNTPIDMRDLDVFLYAGCIYTADAFRMSTHATLAALLLTSPKF